MGKFSGILLCTDFDNTLAYEQRVSPRNTEAIKYFQDNGGLFTIISGRSEYFFNNHTEMIRPNTYLGCVNGSVLYDPFEGKRVWEGFMSGDIVTPVIKIISNLKNIKNIMVFRQEELITVTSDSKTAYEELFDAMSLPVHKLIFHSMPDTPFTQEECRTISEYLGAEFEAMRSWNCGREVQSKGCDKGRAARRIAKLTGAKLLVCVGDYENDISMIKEADIGYAVGNALDSVKEAADRVTVDVREDAIAAVIEDLERIKI